VICPTCGNKSRVIETQAGTQTVNRRRQCLKCRNRWSTIESAKGNRGQTTKTLAELNKTIQEIEAAVDRIVKRFDNLS